MPCLKRSGRRGKFGSDTFNGAFPGIHGFFVGMLVVPVLGHGLGSGVEADAVEAEHVLVADEEVGANIWVEEVSAEKKTVMFHVERDVMTLERDELTLIARLFTERFGKALLVDEHSLQKLEEDFATVQSELLDQMLDQVQRREFRFRMHMVGLRENDRVVVYNR